MESTGLHFERFELKYVLNEQSAQAILETLLKNQLEWDPYVKNVPTKDYTVRTIYYDTPNFKCYYEKMAGVSYRVKLRARVYGNKPTDNIFLELKRRKDSVIIKDRLQIPWSEFSKIKSFTELTNYKGTKAVHDEVVMREKLGPFQPKFLIQYQRQALVGKFEDRLRVTFDRQLSYASTNRLDYQGDLEHFNIFDPRHPELVIMEIKFNNALPIWFKDIIQKHDLNRGSFSKYCELLTSCNLKHKVLN